jgi:hypothetical protein
VFKITYRVSSGDLFSIKIVISSLLLHSRCGQEIKRHGEEGLKEKTPFWSQDGNSSFKNMALRLE